MTQGIGIDFGTTNSVVARADGDTVTSVSWPSVAGLTEVFRTALFFWSEGRAPRAEIRHVAGPAALDRALAGTGEGRLIQSIKTYLASATFRETRLFGQRFTVEELVATFLRRLAADGSADPRALALPVVAGRPVASPASGPTTPSRSSGLGQPIGLPASATSSSPMSRWEPLIGMPAASSATRRCWSPTSAVERATSR